MRLAERRVASTLALALALTGAVSVAGMHDAQAQSAAEIQAARETFGAALRDEQAGNFNDALVKFRQVQKVKDTPQVRYRIATCLAGAGKLREAKKTFAEITAQPGNQEEADVEAAAKEQVGALNARTPTVTVHLRSQPPGGASIKVDGAPATAERPLEVDPGRHTVTLTGQGIKPGELQITTQEGTKQVIEMAVETDAASPPPPAAGSSNRRAYGFIGVGVGGALAVGAIVALVVRNGDIDAIKKDCPNNVCPTATHNDVLSAKSNADTAAIAAGIMGAGALIAGGVGAYFLLTPEKPQGTAIGFAPRDGGGMLQLRGQF